MFTAWSVLWFGLIALIWLGSAAGLYVARDKPPDWTPPAWYRAGIIGEMRRDRFRMNCVLVLIFLPVLLTWYFTWTR